MSDVVARIASEMFNEATSHEYGNLRIVGKFTTGLEVEKTVSNKYSYARNPKTSEIEIENSLFCDPLNEFELSVFNDALLFYGLYASKNMIRMSFNGARMVFEIVEAVMKHPKYTDDTSIVVRGDMTDFKNYAEETGFSIEVMPKATLGTGVQTCYDPATKTFSTCPPAHLEETNTMQVLNRRLRPLELFAVGFPQQNVSCVIRSRNNFKRGRADVEKRVFKNALVAFIPILDEIIDETKKSKVILVKEIDREHPKFGTTQLNKRSFIDVDENTCKVQNSQVISSSIPQAEKLCLLTAALALSKHAPKVEIEWE